MIIVDAHQHYWLPSRGDYGWLDSAPALLQQTFLPEHLYAQRAVSGVNFSVLVQAAPSEAETRYLFELAQADPAVIGVVGWVDMEVDDVGARIDALIRDGNGLLCGLRPMVQDIADPAWLSRPSLDRAFDCIQQHGLSFDALTSLPQIPALLQRLQRHPGLKVVLDHAGKPAIGSEDITPWADCIDQLSQHPQLHCKLSGLLTLLGGGVSDAAIEPYVEHLFACFGAKRLLWGSDWPVLTLQASYKHWLDLALRLTERFAPGAAPYVFAGNAARFYARDLAATELRSNTAAQS
jgi:L-fuconolactonase